MSEDMERQDAVDEVKMNLRDYLEARDVKISNNKFSCLNKEGHHRGDRDPSCSITKFDGCDFESFHCFGCGITGDIYTAAFYLEDKPITGMEFYVETVPHLCSMYDIQYEPIELNRDEKERYQKERAHRDAAEIITSVTLGDEENDIIKKLKDRGISPLFAQKMMVGGILSAKDYLKKMEARGWTKDYLGSAGLLTSDLFHPDSIIFTIKDEKGKIVGFVNRRIPWISGESQKYYNSPTSDIYKKARILYNLDVALKQSKKGPLYITEGYVDALTMYKSGIKRTAAIGSTSFTDDHVDLLSELGIRNIILCFDGDVRGVQGTQKALDELNKIKFFDIKIIRMPTIEGESDPDEYIKRHGVNKFKELEKMTPFKWSLYNMDLSQSPEDIVKHVMPMVLNEDSHMSRLGMIRDVSRVTGINIEDIRREMIEMEDKNKFEYVRKAEEIASKLAFKLKRARGMDIKTVLENAIVEVSNLNRSNETPTDSLEDYKNEVDIIMNRCMTNPELLGFKTPHLLRLQDALDGFPKGQCMIALAARPNVGKTSWMRYLGWELVKYNKDVILLMMSIDDSIVKVVPAMVALESDIAIQDVRKFATLPDTDRGNAAKKSILEGWKSVKDNDRFIVKDVKDGNTINDLRKHIEYCLKTFEGKNLVVFLDNLHKVGSSESGSRDLRHQITEISQAIKRISVEYNIPIMSTVELRKLERNDKKPALSDLKESVQIEYDNDIVFLMHQELHCNRETLVKYTYCDPYTDIEYDMPYVEIEVAKNKETGFKNTLGYKFISNRSRFEEVDMIEIHDKYHDERTRKSVVRNMKANDPCLTEEVGVLGL